MSAALIIGGKDLVEEQNHIKTMNIIIATPGRLLQHMDETSSFAYDNL
jgi:ATP-dependent RNA helicase DDX10/DBP4